MFVQSRVKGAEHIHLDKAAWEKIDLVFVQDQSGRERDMSEQRSLVKCLSNR
jgi:hypothetical protein